MFDVCWGLCNALGDFFDDRVVGLVRFGYFSRVFWVICSFSPINIGPLGIREHILFVFRTFLFLGDLLLRFF